MSYSHSSASDCPKYHSTQRLVSITPISMYFKAAKILVYITIFAVVCTALPETASPAGPATMTCSTVATGLLCSLNESKDVRLFGRATYLNSTSLVTTAFLFNGPNALNFDTRINGTINVEFQGCAPNPGRISNTPGGQNNGESSRYFHPIIDV